MSATALLYGIQAAAGLGQGIYGYSQMQRAKEREALLRAQGMPEMQTPQEYFEMYQNASRSRQFEQEKAMTQSILASNLATLQSGGSRALIGGAGAAQLTAQRGIASAAERDFARQQQALGQLAAAQQRTAQLNFQARSNQYARDLMAAQAGYQAGAETMISGAETALGASALLAQSRKNKRNDIKRSDEDPISGGFVDGFGREVSVRPGMEDQFTPIGEYSPGVTTVPDVTVPEEQFGTYVPFDRQAQLDLDDSLFGSSPLTEEENRRFDAGLFMPNVNIGVDALNKAQGGSVTTPGKYTADHSLEYDVKTKGGKTIATLTGDETLVFNPKQRRFLKRIIGRLFNGGPISMSKNERKAAQETFKAFNR